MEHVIVILSVLIFACLVFIIYNLLRNVEFYEDLVESHIKSLKNINTLIIESDRHIKSLDEKGIFQGDDEVGQFFKTLQNIQKEINEFKIPEVDAKKK